ncbi:DUF6232 family protein [Phytohabitans houttuyneae]|uniref:Uncharacterized protein n=1 Tax=Phytohabitans houttuyneae TaxID=1076126 RepID=A0A6V8KTD0_9ACTN|nr:DUF6232 family protein [Phytohabitans houttuyneae]GFJ85928.1 hypothetical protein Phou_101080 [Phytohabitans houttuyneae]
MSVDHLSRPGRSPGFTAYYHQRGVAVTDKWLVVHGSRFMIAELHHLERARGPLPSPARSSLYLGLAVMGVAAPVALVFSTPLAWVIAALAAAAALGVMMFSCRRWPASYQMWADYGSRPTLLFETGDGQEFGQVSRALIRAVEHRRRGQLI